MRNTNLVEDLELVAEDEIKFTIIKADVDVDTDNDNGFDAPERNLAEDHYEDIADSADYPGKLMAVNDNDDDGDGIPDFADGYGLGLYTNDNAKKQEGQKAGGQSDKMMFFEHSTQQCKEGREGGSQLWLQLEHHWRCGNHH